MDQVIYFSLGFDESGCVWNVSEFGRLPWCMFFLVRSQRSLVCNVEILLFREVNLVLAFAWTSVEGDPNQNIYQAGKEGQTMETSIFWILAHSQLYFLSLHQRA